jgi:hypothetical protein
VTAAFTLVLPGGDAAAVVAPWTVVAPDDLAFAAGDAPPEAPVWQVSLPVDRGEALTMLTSARHALARENAALRSAAAEISTLSARVGVAGGADELTGRAAELMAAFAPPDAETSFRVEVSFGSLGDRFERAAEWFRAAWERVRWIVERESWVETKVDGRLLGRSCLGRTGHLLTAWGEQNARSDDVLHSRAVRLALASRASVLRLLTLVIRSAVLLAGALASPGAALLAVPAVWRSFEAIRAELAAG